MGKVGSFSRSIINVKLHRLILQLHDINNIFCNPYIPKILFKCSWILISSSVFVFYTLIMKA